MTDELTPADIPRIKAYCKAATPSPWLHTPENRALTWEWTQRILSDFGCIAIVHSRALGTEKHCDQAQAAMNAEFITASRTDLPAAIAAIELAWKERDAADEQYRSAMKRLLHYSNIIYLKESNPEMYAVRGANDAVPSPSIETFAELVSERDDLRSAYDALEAELKVVQAQLLMYELNATERQNETL